MRGGVPPVGKRRETAAIVECEQYRAALHHALRGDSVDNLIASERAAGARQDFFNDIGYDAGLVSPLLQRVHSASDQHEPRIQNQLVVHRRGVSGLVIEFRMIDMFRDDGKMQRTAVLLEYKVNLVAHALRTNAVPRAQPPFAERILLDVARAFQVRLNDARDNLLVFIVRGGAVRRKSAEFMRTRLRRRVRQETFRKLLELKRLRVIV